MTDLQDLRRNGPQRPSHPRAPVSGDAVVADGRVASVRMEIPQSVRDLVATGPLGHLVTLDPDGTPHVTLVWAGFDGDELVFATFPDQHKLESIRRDSRVVVSFQAKESSSGALHPYAVITGRGRVTAGGALEWMDHLAHFYVGPGEKFPMRDVPAGFVVRVSVDRIYGVGPWGHDF
jgi:PPOX class probable F420-dependent enzyme